MKIKENFQQFLLLKSLHNANVCAILIENKCLGNDTGGHAEFEEGM